MGGIGGHILRWTRTIQLVNGMQRSKKTAACNRPMRMGRQTAKTMEFIGFVKSETSVFTEKSTHFGRGTTILRLRKPWNL